MSHLQKILDDIEAEAAQKSAAAIAGQATIEAAYNIRDRLLVEEGFAAMVTVHTHYNPLRISIHAQKWEEDQLRIALAGLDIATMPDAGDVMIAPGVFASFNRPATWHPLKEAA